MRLMTAVLMGMALSLNTAMAASEPALNELAKIFGSGLPGGCKAQVISRTQKRVGYNSMEFSVTDSGEGSPVEFLAKDLQIDLGSEEYSPSVEYSDAGVTFVRTYDLQWDEVAPGEFDGPFVRQVNVMAVNDVVGGRYQSVRVEWLEKFDGGWKLLKKVDCQH